MITDTHFSPLFKRDYQWNSWELFYSQYTFYRLLELEMPWDPLKDSLEPALQIQRQMLRYDTQEKNKSIEVEIFKKIDLSRVKGRSCIIHDRIRSKSL